MSVAIALSQMGHWRDVDRVGELVAARYRLQRLIARGAMGEVYDAYDRVLMRSVALKLMRAAPSDDPTRLFLREARLAARFEHPNVVRIFDVGCSSEGQPFLVMELISGRSYAELLRKEGPMPVERAAWLLEGIAEGLDSVHALGVVHRDIKLDNLILEERPDGSLLPKLLDFGVAVAPRDGQRPPTNDGAMVGTPLFMAPEACAGQIDRSSDLYSLAVVAFKLITGMAPFERLEPLQVVRAKLEHDAPPPSLERPELSPAIDDFFGRALARMPGMRFGSAVTLVRELRRASRPQTRFWGLLDSRTPSD
jgi:eukaryotic-like serine/threonine-protein kinase